MNTLPREYIDYLTEHNERNKELLNEMQKRFITLAEWPAGETFKIANMMRHLEGTEELKPLSKITQYTE
jgi:lipopolysaccharide biosynthesis protein